MVSLGCFLCMYLIGDVNYVCLQELFVSPKIVEVRSMLFVFTAGLPVQVRDSFLKKAGGNEIAIPDSDPNREYYMAQQRQLVRVMLHFHD